MEYDAADCHVEAVAFAVGHIPPKIYKLAWDAFAETRVEKLNPLDRKSAPGKSAEVTPLAVEVLSSAHVPLPLMLIFDGVNLHNVELEEVEQEPAYTDISPVEEREGMKAIESSLRNGKSVVMVCRDKLAEDSVDDIFKAAR